MLKDVTFVREKDRIGTVQSIKMVPVTPRSKVLPEANKINNT